MRGRRANRCNASLSRASISRLSSVVGRVVRVRSRCKHANVTTIEAGPVHASLFLAQHLQICCRIFINGMRLLLLAVVYLGLALLVAGTAVGSVLAFRVGNWYGVAISTIFFGLIVFFAHWLWYRPKSSPPPPAGTTSNIGWYGESLTALFRGPILHTTEGRALIAGSVLSLVLAVLAWTAPSILALDPSRSTDAAALLSVWPIGLFVIYARVCGPDFRSRAFTSVLMVCAVVSPIYTAYKFRSPKPSLSISHALGWEQNQRAALTAGRRPTRSEV